MKISNVTFVITLNMNIRVEIANSQATHPICRSKCLETSKFH